MPTTLTNGIQLPDKGSVDWYSSMQSNYNLIDTHLGDTDTHVTAEDKANWNSKQGSLSQAQLDAIAQVATNTSDITALQSGKANASHTHSSSDITDIGDYATKQYVDNSISGLVDNAPAALDTLKELSTALNDDANFASTVTTALSTKANSADLATVATSGDYNDLDNLPTIPTKTSDLSNDSDFVVSSNLATVATSGDYDDLSNKPSIPTNTSDLNNDSGFVTLNDFDIPSKTSDLTNDSGFITSSDVPTSTSDLINDSNFVDTSNSAVASGITSAKVTSYDSHVVDTDIHVTAADKSKWNNGVSQSYVLRYSSSSVTDNSTIAYSTLDNTDNIKANDKVIDVNGKIFSIVSVDTANQTVTVGSALIDLALDANVVHLTGSETITGAKYFNGIIYSIGGIQTRLSTRVTSGEDSSKSWAFIDNAYKSLFKLVVSTNTDKSTRVEHVIYNVDSNNTETLNRITWRFDNNSSVSELRPTDNAIKLGTSTKHWSEVYATNYYYGSNNVEFSTKFVTTDTNQTISGQKVFNDINAISSSAEIGVSRGNNSFKVLDKNKKTISRLESGTFSTGMTYSDWLVNNGSDVFNGVSLYQASANLAHLRPNSSTLSVQLGASNRYFSDCYTSKINGLTPSSLGMPVAPSSTSYVDISSYITVVDSSTPNTYTPPSNGYITFSVTGNLVQIFHDYGLQGKWSVQAGNANRGFIPVLGGVEVKIYVTASSIDKFWFIPCQGNV